MKKLYILLLFVTAGLMAQVPQGFSYQAIALNATGEPIVSATVKIRVSILEESAIGMASYVETHTPTTNNVGLFTLTIGQGTATTGTFSGINWSQSSKFLKVEIDIENGINFVTVGSSQLLSVPYAMYAGSVAGTGGNGGTGNTLADLYMYGTFNAYNPDTAVPFINDGYFYLYKYLASGTQVKFITSPAASTAYGNAGNNYLGLNSNAFNINATGIYFVQVNYFGEGQYQASLHTIAVNVATNYGESIPMNYNVATNTLSCTVEIPETVSATGRRFHFDISNSPDYGDNLGDGSIDINGTDIQFPSAGTFVVALNLNTSGSGSIYTITAQ